MRLVGTIAENIFSTSRNEVTIAPGAKGKFSVSWWTPSSSLHCARVWKKGSDPLPSLSVVRCLRVPKGSDPFFQTRAQCRLVRYLDDLPARSQ